MQFRVFFLQENLLKSVSHKMAKIREAFPRLFFLSDDEVLELLLPVSDPRKLMPIVRKCFPGIKSLQFSFPEKEEILCHGLDATLKGKFDFGFIDRQLSLHNL